MTIESNEPAPAFARYAQERMTTYLDGLRVRGFEMRSTFVLASASCLLLTNLSHPLILMPQ